MRSMAWLILGAALLTGPVEPTAGGGVDFSVRVEARPLTGPVEQAMAAELVLEAKRRDSPSVPLRALLDLPPSLGGVRQVLLDLGGQPSASQRVEVELPAGPSRVWEIPVRVFAHGQPRPPVRGRGEDRGSHVPQAQDPFTGRPSDQVFPAGRQLLRTDVRLTKAGPWWVIAPFPGNRAESHDRVFPPEEEIELAGAYQGKGGQRVGWQPFPASARQASGLHDLNSALGPTEDAVAYVFAACHARAAQPARLLIGSDDSVKIWHNGNLVHDHNLHRGAEPAQDEVAVQLVQGRNTFLMKVVNDDGGWGYFFEIDDGEGQPVPELQWEVGVATVPLTDPRLRLVEVTRDVATLEWRSDEPAPAAVHWVEAEPGRTLVWGSTPKEEMIAPRPGAREQTVRVEERTTRHRARITGLKPGARYLLWVDPAVRGQRSEKLAFSTAAPEGQAQYIHLPIIAGVFTNAAQQKDAGRPGADAPCPPEERERLKREIEQAVRWYWVNTGLRLLLEVDYVFDDRFVATPDGNPYGVGYTPGDEQRLKEVVERNGRRLSDYDGRLFITFEKAWNEAEGRWFYPASGGGTIGPEGEPGFGKAAWKGGSDNSWLFCHEFGHQLDALYHHSMGPEYLFNHFQPWDDTAHRHGEHWDGNAWLLWEWAGYVTRGHPGRPFLPATKWFRFFQLRWGEVRTTADADHDGIPDADPRVPVDERRFGSSPARRDTDGDGLSDLMELMACQWLDQGLNETWTGGYLSHSNRCDPTRPDTDEDGLPDGRDPYPLYGMRPRLYSDDLAQIAFVTHDGVQTNLSAGWTSQSLSFELHARQAPEEWRIMLDADDDGWFVGADNFMIRVQPQGGLRLGGEWRVNQEGTLGIGFHHCGVPGRWPFWDRSRLDPDLFELRQETTGEGYRAWLQVRRQPRNGVQLRQGERIGLLFGARPRDFERPGVLTAFEPHTFVSFRLVE